MGQVTKAPDGSMTIRLTGTLGPNPIPIGNPDPDLLHGLTSDGTHLTARSPMATGGTIGLVGGFAIEEYRARSAIIGGHVDDTTLYDTAILETTYLREWLQQSGIRIDVQPGGEGKPRSIGATFQHPPVQTSRVSDKATVSTWTSVQTGRTRLGSSLMESVALKVVLDEPVSLDDLVSQYVMPLLDMVCFGTARTNAIDHLTVNSPYVVRDVGSTTSPIDLEFIANWIGKVEGEVTRLTPDQMLFGILDAPNGFDSLISQWFHLYGKLRLSLAPYFGLMYAPPTYIDLHLVSISQALEAYHRTAGLRHQVLSKTAFQSLKKALLDAAPAEYLAFVTQRLSYFNEPTQVERLTELVSRVAISLTALLANRTEFVRNFIDARNLKTHPSKRKRQFTALELYDLSQVATYILEANILLDVGFNVEQAKVLFERNAEYAHLAANLPR